MDITSVLAEAARDSRVTIYEEYEARPLCDGTGMWALFKIVTRSLREDPRLVEFLGRLTWTNEGLPKWHDTVVQERRCGPAVSEAAARDKARRLRDAAIARIGAYLDSI